MVTHVSATPREETPHATETTNTATISDALRRRAQSVISDIWIDRQWRAVISYALETNDPSLPDLVARADAGEPIIDTIGFSQTRDTDESDVVEQRICTLAGIICEAGDKPAAALFVLMGMLENSVHPKLLTNTAKHFAFARCADSNLYGMVDAQVAVLADELFDDSIGAAESG